MERRYAAAMLLVALTCASAAATTLDEAYQAAVEAHRLQQNAVLLALRVAGAAWIAIEWVAAVVLLLGFHQLRSIARSRGLLP